MEAPFLFPYEINMNTSIGKPAKPQHWLGLLALFTFLGWIIPNHHRPWTSFHAEAWLGAGFLIFAVQAIWRGNSQWRLNVPLLAVGILLFVPFSHFKLGMVHWESQAWIGTLYIFSFWMAMAIGFNASEKLEQEGCDFIFLIITLAGVVSVGLQLLQWFGNDSLDFWLMNTGTARPSANFGQPNQLATMLLWAMAAVIWWWQKKFIGRTVAAIAIAYFLIGMALTQSRAAFLNVLLLTVALVAVFWVKRRIKYILLSLMPIAWLSLCLYITTQNYGNDASGVVGGGNLSGRLTETTRPQIWQFFLNAVSDKPWFGYGWNQTGRVHVDLALSSPITGVHFGSAHNIVLDLMLWIGVPFTFLIVFFIIRSFVKTMPSLRIEKDSPILFCILVVGVHAMLEFPLSYAYFLMPTGYFMGVLYGRSSSEFCFKFYLPKEGIWIIFSVALVTYLVVVRDYFSVELRYNEMLFEKARIGVNHPRQIPDVVVLNDLQALIRMARVEPTADASGSDIESIRQVVRTFPSAGNFFLLAQMYALKNDRVMAQIWLTKGCVLISEIECNTLRLAWNAKAIQRPELLNVFPVARSNSK